MRHGSCSLGNFGFRYHPQSSKFKKLAARYSALFSGTAPSFTGLRGSLVMLGDGGFMSGGTAKNCRSVIPDPGRRIGGRGLAFRTSDT